MNYSEEVRKFYAGESCSAYRFLGCHRAEQGFVFRLWAPNAVKVGLSGDFSGWTPLDMSRNEGIWELTVPGAREFDCYKSVILGPDGEVREKCDPYAFHSETRPATASKVYDIGGFEWHDGGYFSRLEGTDPYSSPLNIYEVHLGSWKTYPDGSPFDYSKLASELVGYVSEMGYTHIELLPVTEHPLDDSWGYQVTGWFAPTSRYGTPKDFMKFVDSCHKAGIGVILDWVGAHFPKDSHGLMLFDGTPCYESADPLMSEHPEWGTKIFDYSRNEVRSFLSSSVCFWLDVYHADGIRADAVASMLYLDYGRKHGELRPDTDGGNVNLHAVSFLRQMNGAAFAARPSALMIAEESTAFPMITKPAYDGGLGFGFKWNMGWMHDTLDYMSADPVMRGSMHEKLTFSMSYAFSENYILPLSHDEVVHGKRSMIGRMPGSYEDKFRSLRLMYAYMFAHPGKKLNFMGNEFGQFIEWNYHRELDWFLLSYDEHLALFRYCRELNHFYLNTPALWENDTDWNGFHWVKVDDREHSVAAFTRTSRSGETILVVFNFIPVKVGGYRLGFDDNYSFNPVFSSDGAERKETASSPAPYDGMPYSAGFDLEPLSAVFYSVSKPAVVVSAGDKKPIPESSGI